MRLSFKHSNPVVFWAINTPVGTLAQRLHGYILLLDLRYFKYFFSIESPAMVAISLAN
ncbi:MAG: hypothetical protein J7J01_03710 [Methanophagales archaeon]|nr:hypothetical protein [Methanophagales archaeon]